MPKVRELSAFREAPTGPQSSLLRRMSRGGVLEVRNAGGRLEAVCGGEEVWMAHVAGLLARRLIRETSNDDDRSTYGMTERGLWWAMRLQAKAAGQGG